MDERFKPVLEEMQRQVDSGLRPSIQVAVDWRGEVVFEAACGEGATSDSCYLLWSSTKPFVALALLQLVEAGRARLDDSVAHYIPEFAQGGKKAATLAHVLTHRGGFPDNTPERHRPLRRVLHDFDAALAHVCAMPAVWEPGRDRGYHPFSGWVIVGELVQRLAGRPLTEVVRERVLEPAGIDAEAFALGDPERLASPPLRVSTRDERGAPPQSEADFWNDPATQSALIPGAGAISRARELVKLYRALLDGGVGPNGRLLSSEMVRNATYPHAVGIPDRTFLSDIPWGLGFHLKHTFPTLDHCGRTATPGTFGHGGHFLVNTAWGDPGKNLAVCVLANGFCEPRTGVRAVAELSQTVHDVVDDLA